MLALTALLALISSPAFASSELATNIPRLAGPAGGGGGQVTASILNATANTDCISTNVSFDLQSNGGYSGDNIDIIIFDDMVQEYQQTVFVPAGNSTQTISFSYADPNIGVGAPGIGLVLFDSQGTQLDIVDPLLVDEEPSCGNVNPVVTLTLNPNPALVGQPFVISWNATNATGFNPCVASLGEPTNWSQTQFRPRSGQEAYIVDTPGVINFAMQCESATGLMGDAVAVLTVNPQADLSITLTDSPNPVAAGSNLSYTATLSNGGPSVAVDASIRVLLPVGISIVSATPSAGGVCNASSPLLCTWAGATAPAATRIATVVGLVSSTQITSLSATATAASSTLDADPASNTASSTTAVIAQAVQVPTLAQFGLLLIALLVVTSGAGALRWRP